MSWQIGEDEKKGQIIEALKKLKLIREANAYVIVDYGEGGGVNLGGFGGFDGEALKELVFGPRDEADGDIVLADSFKYLRPDYIYIWWNGVVSGNEGRVDYSQSSVFVFSPDELIPLGGIGYHIDDTVGVIEIPFQYWEGGMWVNKMAANWIPEEDEIPYDCNFRIQMEKWKLRTGGDTIREALNEYFNTNGWRENYHAYAIHIPSLLNTTDGVKKLKMLNYAKGGVNFV